MGHDIQEWTKSKLRKTAFKKLYMACLDIYIKTVESSCQMFIKNSLLEIFAKFTCVEKRRKTPVPESLLAAGF